MLRSKETIKMAKSTTTKYTPAQQAKMLQDVKGLRKTMSLHKALEKIGLPYSTYNYWNGYRGKPRTKAATKKSKTFQESFLMNLSGDETPIVVLIGRPQDVNASLDKLVAITRR